MALPRKGAGAALLAKSRDAITLSILGIAFGVVLAYAAGRSLQALLAGVPPTDAPIFLSAIALCFVMTLAGSLLPARRAVRMASSAV